MAADLNDLSAFVTVARAGGFVIRAVSWRLRFQFERGGAAIGGEARREVAESYHAQHRPDRGGCPSARATDAGA